jgi:hypothetical protein
MPAPKGNRNRTAHGIYGYLATGSLPKGASYIRRQLGNFERELRRRVLEKRGEVSVLSAALIQTAVRHEGRAQLLNRWLRQADENLKVADKLALLREIGNASDRRDAVLKQLDLEVSADEDIAAALYSSPAAPLALPDQPADEPAHSTTATPRDGTHERDNATEAMPTL